MADLFDPAWELDDLDEGSLGPYVPPVVSDAEKAQVWADYRAGHPSRVPVVLATNSRVAVLDERITHGGRGFEQVFAEPEAMVRASLHHKYLRRKRYHRFTDNPCAFPESWETDVSFQNTYEAWFFGCPLVFHTGQVPDTSPILKDDSKRAVFDVDIDHPLERPPFKTFLEYYHFMEDYVADKTFLGRPITVERPLVCGTDGPLTVAMNVRGPSILMDLVLDPGYVDELMAFFVEAAIKRRRALLDYFSEPGGPEGMADDSVAMIGIEQYKEALLPHHRHWYDSTGSTFGSRSIHLCGDATHLFPTLKEELGITSFDTGFPVDFAWLREVLGPGVEIHGGVEVAMLKDGTPEQVYERSREILTSGVTEGGRFVFREGNNLPPDVTWENLAAMYQAALDFGRYE